MIWANLFLCVLFIGKERINIAAPLGAKNAKQKQKQKTTSFV